MGEHEQEDDVHRFGEEEDSACAPGERGEGVGCMEECGQLGRVLPTWLLRLTAWVHAGCLSALVWFGLVRHACKVCEDFL